MNKVYIIAEAGVNHNGDLKLAFDLIDVAKESGADAVKFQTFKADNLVTESAKMAKYQTQNTNSNQSQYEMLKKLELSDEEFIKISNYCSKKNIDFLSTAFDHESLEFLDKKISLKTLKIASGELTNAPLLLDHARTQKKLIVSTGMATLEEIETALGIIAFGYLNPNKEVSPASEDDFKKAFYSKTGKENLVQNVTLLHCTTEYPAPYSSINLNALDLMRDKFEIPIGYSDHSNGISVSLAAVSKGANIIEKHFTLDKNLAGPDHKASLDPEELKMLVNEIRNIQISLGDYIKVPTAVEKKNINVARKSIVAARSIKKGETFISSSFKFKRPGHGISPLKYWELLGQVAKKDYKENDLI